MQAIQLEQRDRRGGAELRDEADNRKPAAGNRFQFGFEAFNAINKYYFGRNNNFETNPNDANFGTLFPSLTSNQNFSPRTMQVRLKFLW